MAAPYRDILQRIRLAFPQPVSDRVHDSYFVHSIMRALDQVDALKSELPVLGRTVAPDYEAARREALRPQAASLEEVTAQLVGYLEGMTIFGHPRTQQNVIVQPSIASLIGVLLRLLGYDPELSAGVFTFGGTGTTLYGV